MLCEFAEHIHPGTLLEVRKIWILNFHCLYTSTHTTIINQHYPSTNTIRFKRHTQVRQNGCDCSKERKDVHQTLGLNLWPLSDLESRVREPFLLGRGRRVTPAIVNNLHAHPLCTRIDPVVNKVIWISTTIQAIVVITLHQTILALFSCKPGFDGEKELLACHRIEVDVAPYSVRGVGLECQVDGLTVVAVLSAVLTGEEDGAVKVRWDDDGGERGVWGERPTGGGRAASDFGFDVRRAAEE